MSGPAQAPSTEFDLLGDSWEMAMEADGYAAGTRHGYRKAPRLVRRLAGFRVPDAGPTDATRAHIRGWLVALRRQRAQNTARTYYAGVRTSTPGWSSRARSRRTRARASAPPPRPSPKPR